MSLIFISHSSRDNTKAAEIKSWLEHPDRGYSSVFLDFDPADGIPAGRDWERELYARLRGSQAVIVLCSEHSMASEWCFAEITQARALGKICIAVKIGPCALKPVLTRDQVIDLTSNEAEGYQRLSKGLLEAGLDPRNLFQWDATRPPYPGLMAFQEQDAAIFHGRDKDIQQTIELLNRMRRLQTARAAVILGASGSGKSSLLRAGILPRLKRTTEWIVVGALQPRSHPIDQLARVLQDGFDLAGDSRPWREIRDILLSVERDEDASPLLDLAYDLQRARKSREAVVLIALDQAEELWAQASAASADAFLRVLRLALETPDTPFLALATLRSDYLEPFQSSFAHHRIRFEPSTLAPMPVEDLPQLVEKPAALAGLILEPGLVHAMVMDTRHSDALSLLAFALRELWELRPRDGRLTLDMYRTQLGGLHRALERAAEQTITACGVTEESERLLRRAFISLARVDDAGRFVRNPVLWSSLPEAARESLRRFVAARLLVSSEMQGAPVVEVAHEDLFRAWTRLNRWLEDDRLFLLGRKRLAAALAEWLRLKRDEALLLRGGVLSEAEGWLAERRSELSEGEREFIEASVASREAERAEERRQLEEERQLRERAEQQQRYAESREFAARALLVMDDDPAEALLSAVHSGRRAATREAELVLRRAIAGSSLRAVLRHNGAVLDAAFNPDGTLVATAGADGIVAIWHAASRRVLHRLTGHQGDRYHREVFRIDFSPDGKTLASAGKGGVIRLWDVDTGLERLALTRHTGSIMHVGFNREGTRLVSSSADCTVRVWDVERGEACHEFSGHMGTSWHAEFSPDGRFVVAGAGDSYTVFLWDLETGKHAASGSTGGRVVCNRFSPNGKLLVTASVDAEAMVWNVADPHDVREVGRLPGHVGGVRYAAFESDERIITCGADGTARTWRWDSGPSEGWRQVDVLGHGQTVLHASIAGDKAVTAGEGGTAFIWERRPGDVLRTESWNRLVALRGHKGAVVRARFSPDGLSVLTASADGSARLWNAEPGHECGLIRRRGNLDIKNVAYAPDGRRVAISTSGFFHNRTEVIDLEPERRVSSLRPKQTGWLDVGSTPRGVCFNPDGRRLVTWQYLEKAASVWDADTGTMAVELVGHADNVQSARFTEDGASVLTTGEDNAIGIWDAESGRPIVLLEAPGRISGEAFLDRERVRLVAWSLDGGPRVWTAPEWQGRDIPLEGLDRQGVTSFAFTSDTRTLVTGTTDGVVQLWNAESGIEIGRAPAHPGAIRRVRFSGNDQRAVSVAADGEIRVWDVGDPASYVAIRHESGATNEALSHDGLELLTFHADGNASGVGHAQWRIARAAAGGTTSFVVGGPER